MGGRGRTCRWSALYAASTPRWSWTRQKTGRGSEVEEVEGVFRAITCAGTGAGVAATGAPTLMLTAAVVVHSDSVGGPPESGVVRGAGSDVRPGLQMRVGCAGVMRIWACRPTRAPMLGRSLAPWLRDGRGPTASMTWRCHGMARCAPPSTADMRLDGRVVSAGVHLRPCLSTRRRGHLPAEATARPRAAAGRDRRPRSWSVSTTPSSKFMATASRDPVTATRRCGD